LIGSEEFRREMECGRRDVEVIVGAIRDGGEETRELRRRIERTRW
jgi:hypothetical protein